MFRRRSFRAEGYIRRSSVCSALGGQLLLRNARYTKSPCIFNLVFYQQYNEQYGGNDSSAADQGRSVPEWPGPCRLNAKRKLRR